MSSQRSAECLEKKMLKRRIGDQSLAKELPLSWRGSSGSKCICKSTLITQLREAEEEVYHTLARWHASGAPRTSGE